MKKADKFIFIILLALGFLPLAVSGAQIGFFPESGETGLGQFRVDVVLDTRGETINAIEGNVVFPQNFLALNRISYGDSMIDFWIQNPKLESGGKIFFSGIVPAGYSGKGKIFSVVFRALEEGDAFLRFVDPEILLNDGKGTPADLEAGRGEITINPEIKPEEIKLAEAGDFEQPESFVINLANDKNIFDGKWFIVFDVQDKNSGIDRYEVAERRPGFPNFLMRLKWNAGESPYLLSDQKLKSDIYVKAVDKAGNRRIQYLSPYPPARWYKNWLIWITIIIAAASVCLARGKLIFKRKKHE